MNSRELRKVFAQLAKSYNFESAYNGWYIDGIEFNNVLDLQRSGYGNYYYLRPKVYVHGAFGKTYPIEKSLVKTGAGHVSGSVPEEFYKSPASKEYDQILEIPVSKETAQRVALTMDQKMKEPYDVFSNNCMHAVLSSMSSAGMSAPYAYEYISPNNAFDALKNLHYVDRSKYKYYDSK